MISASSVRLFIISGGWRPPVNLIAFVGCGLLLRKTSLKQTAARYVRGLHMGCWSIMLNLLRSTLTNLDSGIRLLYGLYIKIILVL
jgi:hypothetical protein